MLNISSIKNIDLNEINYTPLVIFHVLKPIGLHFCSSFATNVTWEITQPLDKLKICKTRFTNFINNLAKDDYKKADLMLGSMFLHIVPPERYLDVHMDTIIQPKQYIIKHWRLEENWWRFDENQLKTVHENFMKLEINLDKIMQLFSILKVRPNGELCFPTHKQVQTMLDITVLLQYKPIQGYMFGRYNSFEKNKQDSLKQAMIKNYNDFKKIHWKKPVISKIKPERPKHNPPRRPDKLKKERPGRKIFFSKMRSRLSVVKVPGEYWGWDFYYTQFRIKKETTKMSRSEVIVKEIEQPKKSMIKHLLWCFKQYRLAFKSTYETADLLRSLF